MPTLALDTVRQTLNVKINYLITVDFSGFRRIVDHVGCVYTDVERRYFNQNGQPGSGDYSNIDLKAGYQSLCGAQALSYVRFRHQDNDIYRITRQQAFLRELKHKLDLTTVGANFVSLVNDVADSVKIASQFKHKPGPQTLIGFARALAQVPKSRTLQLKLLGDQGGAGAQYVNVGAAEIQSTVAEFLNPNFSQSTAAADVGGRLAGPAQAEEGGGASDLAEEAQSRDAQRLGRRPRLRERRGGAPQRRLHAHGEGHPGAHGHG